MLARYFALSVASYQKGFYSPRPQYAINSRINDSLKWLIVTQNKAIAGPIVAQCLGVHRSIVARGGAVGDDGLL